MSTLTITIEAPEIAAAIRDLAAAIGGARTANATLPQISTPVAPVAAIPVETAPVATVVPAAPVAQIPDAQSAVPTTAATYTLDQLAKAASPLIDAGKLVELQGLLKQFGAPDLTKLAPEQYGAFATALRGLGAKI